VHIACNNGDATALAELLNYGYDPNQATEHGYLPIHIACDKGHVDAVRQLIASNASLNLPDRNGATAAHWCCIRGRVGCLDLLLEAGIIIHAQDNQGRTPLHHATKWNQHECARKLLQRGANANAMDHRDETPLIMYHSRESVDMQRQSSFAQSQIPSPMATAATPRTLSQVTSNTLSNSTLPSMSSNVGDATSTTITQVSYNVHCDSQVFLDPQVNQVSSSLNTNTSRTDTSLDSQVSFSFGNESLPSLRDNNFLSPNKRISHTALDYRENDRKGVGEFGQVFVATYLQSNQRVALKILNGYSPETVDTFQKECECMWKIDHKNIVKWLHYIDDPHNSILGYTMELMDDNLRSILNERKPSLCDALRYAIEVAQGLVYLHSQKLAHNDLKPENVLLRVDPDTGIEETKLCDFGAVSTRDAVSKTASHGIMTMHYAAPERLSGSRRYSLAADVYSFGIVLNELLSGKKPYHNENLDPFGFSVDVIQGKRPEMAHGIPDKLRELIEKCWSEKSGQRPSMTVVLESLQNFLVEFSTISYDDLVFGEGKLGKGGFGSVRKAQCSVSKKSVAVKTLLDYSDNIVKHFQKEWRCLKLTTHQNIVTAHYSFRDPKKEIIGYTMELMDYNLKWKMRAKKLEFEEVLFIALQIANGLCHLHENDLAHNDLKPENVLLCEQSGKRQVKLCDFGAVSTREHVARSCTHMQHTPRYTSPERLKGGKYALSTDVYSYGILLNEMLTGERPFKDTEGIAMFFAVFEEKKRPALCEGIPDELKEMIERCWHHEAEQRPTMVEVRAVLEELYSGFRD